MMLPSVLLSKLALKLWMWLGQKNGCETSYVIVLELTATLYSRFDEMEAAGITPNSVPYNTVHIQAMNAS